MVFPDIRFWEIGKVFAIKAHGKSKCTWYPSPGFGMTKNNPDYDLDRRGKSFGLVRFVFLNWELERLSKLYANGALSAEMYERATKKTSETAQQMGDAFGSAFEDAILSGKNFGDVLTGLQQDLARIIIRRTITVPRSIQINSLDFCHEKPGNRLLIRPTTMAVWAMAMPTIHLIISSLMRCSIPRISKRRPSISAFVANDASQSTSLWATACSFGTPASRSFSTKLCVSKGIAVTTDSPVW
uniref:Uncharacterized protein n=1 Tax=Candidatus Kentrum sp. MB TaxID=2138164 RepID=A0A451BAV0_9GAMM|nr:MAG: hypothetical protein BECKMB1821G_GA0114241_102455 [Candidatus Kentron sp. MB]VFK31259.1 MAG: hypothetical protein BECKMB1821I_GA0114274_102154 [Candidatus Kentron sp. MB]VFK75421.1 MAG: hypothetical protein BECKMB1821H_GA0114242_102155 [Candidatus Kentron sp. MB]